MKTQEVTTTDFGYTERKELINLFTAWNEQGLPDFYNDEITPMMNRNSGSVFLTNADYQTAMMTGQQACQLNDEGCNECQPADDESEV